MATLVDCLEPEALELGGEEPLVGADPLAAGVDAKSGHAGYVLSQRASADPITGFKDDHVVPGCGQPVGGDEASNACADDDGAELHGDDPR